MLVGGEVDDGVNLRHGLQDGLLDALTEGDGGKATTLAAAAHFDVGRSIFDLMEGHPAAVTGDPGIDVFVDDGLDFLGDGIVPFSAGLGGLGEADARRIFDVEASGVAAFIEIDFGAVNLFSDLGLKKEIEGGEALDDVGVGSFVAADELEFSLKATAGERAAKGDADVRSSTSEGSATSRSCPGAAPARSNPSRGSTCARAITCWTRSRVAGSERRSTAGVPPRRRARRERFGER